jgi:hypothetical protein
VLGAVVFSLTEEVGEMLSLWRLLLESLAERVAVGEARPPRREARISGRPRCCGGGVC